MLAMPTTQLNTKAQRQQATVARIMDTIAAPPGVTAANYNRMAVAVVTDTNSDNAAGDLTAQGGLKEFSHKIAEFAQRPSAEILEENVGRLEILQQRATDPSRYFMKDIGCLRRKDGKASGHGIVLTPEGKNQLLGWGDSPSNIAWRDFIFQMYNVARHEMQEMKQYVQDLKAVRQQNKREYHNAIGQLVDGGDTPRSAEGKVRVADKKLYAPLTPGFKSAAEAICAVRGIEQSTINKRRIQRKTVVAAGSQSMQWEHGRMRNKTRIMNAQTGLDYNKCAKIVAGHAQQNGECLHRDQHGNAWDDMTQARINFSSAFDYHSTTPAMVQIAPPTATPMLPYVAT